MAHLCRKPLFEHEAVFNALSDKRAHNAVWSFHYWLLGRPGCPRSLPWMRFLDGLRLNFLSARIFQCILDFHFKINNVRLVGPGQESLRTLLRGHHRVCASAVGEWPIVTLFFPLVNCVTYRHSGQGLRPYSASGLVHWSPPHPPRHVEQCAKAMDTSHLNHPSGQRSLKRSNVYGQRRHTFFRAWR